MVRRTDRPLLQVRVSFEATNLVRPTLPPEGPIFNRSQRGCALHGIACSIRPAIRGENARPCPCHGFPCFGPPMRRLVGTCNHLLEVAVLVAQETDGSDPDLVMAALLHDAIEDQEVPRDVIAETSGEEVAEVTDDKSLPQAERKRPAGGARTQEDRSRQDPQAGRQDQQPEGHGHEPAAGLVRSRSIADRVRNR
jgi:hypothetical protein